MNPKNCYSLVLATLATAAALSAAEPKPVLLAEPPMFGTFYSLTLKQPPFPFNPFPELPVYSTGNGALIYDDSTVDYVQWWAEQAVLAAVIQAAEETSGPGMMAMSEPPPAPGEGGGGGSVTSPPPYSVPGLKLTIPLLSNGAVYTSLMEADTNSAYDLFEQFALKTNLVWARIAGTEIGETNFAVTQLSPTNAFYRAADTTDSDFDGLSDACEQWVTHSNPLSPDSDSDGIPDGREDVNLNGIPDRFDYQRLNRAVIFASRTNAHEGGQSGELTILLPAPAPTNGTTLTLHLGGYTDYGLDYTLATTTGVAVTNDVVLAAGQTQVKLSVNAVDDVRQETRSRRVQVTLASSANYLLDPELADVALVDNDLPLVSIIALDNRAAEASGYGTNTGSFLIRREGSTERYLGIYLAASGTATYATDYMLRLVDEPNWADPLFRLMDPGSNTLIVSLTTLPDANYEGNETATLTLLPDPYEIRYVINTNAAGASVTIADDDLPVISLAGTDLLATEYNSKSAVVGFHRTGNTSQPLTVPIAIGGTATNGGDYQSLPNIITFPANASDVTLNIQPLSDAYEEEIETVLLTIKGSASYLIGISNSVTVLLDDDKPTRYEVIQTKPTAVAWNSPSISSPAVYHLRRLGRSAQSNVVPFEFYTDPGLQRVYYFGVSGDVFCCPDQFAFRTLRHESAIEHSRIRPEHQLSAQIPDGWLDSLSCPFPASVGIRPGSTGGHQRVGRHHQSRTAAGISSFPGHGHEPLL